MPEPETVRARRRKAGGKKRAGRQKKGLPRWFIYVTYFMSFCFAGYASWMIIFYGLTFEPSVARAWLLSAGLSVFMEMFVQDPVKIAGQGVVKDRLMAEFEKWKFKKANERKAEAEATEAKRQAKRKKRLLAA